MKKISFILFLLIIAVAIVFQWASDSAPGPGNITGTIYSNAQETEYNLETPDTLRVMTWNIAYGHGMGSDGIGYHPRTKEEYEERMQSMARLIRDSRADIVLIQEIDFDSSRSHRMNQLQLLSAMSGLQFSAEAISWDAGYVPFPYWPLSHQFGRIKSGGAILSRYPILENDIILHPKPDSNPWYYNAFYLFRYTQTVTVRSGIRQFRVVNNHLDAYDAENREEQAIAIAGLLELPDETNPVIIFGGDMNTVPVKASQLYNFDDGYDDDYRNDNTMGILNDIRGFREIIHDTLYHSSEYEFHTFPASDPNRRLDYIFVSDTLDILDYEFIQAGELSDHIPFITTLVWR